MHAYHRAIDIVRRANQIATSTELDELLRRTLDLFVETAGAAAGTLYLYESATDELVFEVVKGDAASQRLLGTRFPASIGIAGAATRAGEPIFVRNVADDPRWDRSLGELAGHELRTAYCLPLMLPNRIIGVVQVFDLAQAAVDEEEELALLPRCDSRQAWAARRRRASRNAQSHDQGLRYFESAGVALAAAPQTASAAPTS